MMAARQGYTKCLRLLLNHPDIDVNAKDNDGNTALKYARSYRSICRKLLEEHGAT
ncbi:MAG: ankyrin repeat domain-containing protein [bacterium]|nr:ankyrin repeat domain-containing protein [bacterium]